ncbi:hypothetical protein [Tepidimonas taiwanensis]|uniref:hypothetical protein n=1 Tax=Tepidimonas taiwanensis TaxID=307486 RepID=UPI0005BAC4D4|nr:hypothetical protein [Tepidimonas taiwanensis]
MTPERVRELTGWPPEVPDAVLDAHLDLARREVAARVPPALAAHPEALDAVAWLAAASAAPVLHTFALSGAAKVGRLEGAVEWRFLSPAEAEGYAAHCRRQAEACLSRLLSAAGDFRAAGGLFVASV